MVERRLGGSVNRVLSEVLCEPAAKARDGRGNEEDLLLRASAQKGKEGDGRKHGAKVVGIDAHLQVFSSAGAESSAIAYNRTEGRELTSEKGVCRLRC